MTIEDPKRVTEQDFIPNPNAHIDGEPPFTRVTDPDEAQEVSVGGSLRGENRITSEFRSLQTLSSEDETEPAAEGLPHMRGVGFAVASAKD